MKVFIGVDAGGTKTAVALAMDAVVKVSLVGPPGAVRPGRALQAASRITTVIRRALNEAALLHGDVLVVGAAGAGRDPERTELREMLRAERLAERVTVTGDLDIALEAAFESRPGIVLLCGTGSVAVGRTAAGELLRAGGLGWQMGDEGSGYAIARMALIAVGRGSDGRGIPTLLTERVQRALGRDLDGMVRWSVGAEPGEVAALAPHVLQAAADGDEVAQRIAAWAADELAAHVGALAGRFPGAEPIEVALAGGNLGPERALRPLVLERLARIPRARPVEVVVEPVQGALAMASRA